VIVAVMMTMTMEIVLVMMTVVMEGEAVARWKRWMMGAKRVDASKEG
jgi:hypothetical protein